MVNQPRYCQACRNYVPGSQWDAHRRECRAVEPEIEANYRRHRELHAKASNINWIVATGNRKAKRDLLAKLKAEKATLDPKDVQFNVVVKDGIERLEESLGPRKMRS
ncbi:MAG: hypothetical protein F4X66_09405 [Chloroflexi bacterium]|nr:hypothetical protein [Chloroflexota bacterium]MYE41258.1 hypothetical protein [Chloroflexota bacterium]